MKLHIINLFLILILSFSVSAKNRNFITLGDSLTVGTGGTGGQSYRYTLRNMLGADHCTFIGQYGSDPYKHFGVGGQKTFQALPLIQDYLTGYVTPNNNNCYLIHYGTNDVYQGYSKESITENLIGIIDTIYAYDTTAEVYLALITPLASVADNLVISLNTYLRNTVTPIIQNYYHLRLVDMSTAFKLNANWATEYFTLDTTHPNDAGYTVMAQAWYNALDKYVLEGGSITGGTIL